MATRDSPDTAAKLATASLRLARAEAQRDGLLRCVNMMAQWREAGSEVIHFSTLMPDGDDTLGEAVDAAIAACEEVGK